MAKPACVHCHGLGMRFVRYGRQAPCDCVFRAIFRACYGRFRELATQPKHISRVNLEHGHRKDNRMTYGRKSEEYLADFCLVSRRALCDLDYQIFAMHYLDGRDWKFCCGRLKMGRGIFFHRVYEIEQKLGRTFREMQPYGLFPLDEYFGGRLRCRSLAIAELLASPQGSAREPSYTLRDSEQPFLSL